MAAGCRAMRTPGRGLGGRRRIGGCVPSCRSRGAVYPVPLTSLQYPDQRGIASQPAASPGAGEELIRAAPHPPCPPIPKAELMPDLLQQCQEPLGLPEVVNYLAGALGLSERG